MPGLTNRTVFITGATRGIGQAIALRCAKEGANVVITGKTVEKHAVLPGTIYSVAEEVAKLGGNPLPVALDVRDENNIQLAVNQSVEKFGGIDILVNNASAIFLASTLDTPAKRYDLMQAVNARATFLCSQACIPHLKKSANPHILNLSPPLNMKPKWFKKHVAYTISKYGMSMCTLGMSAELANDGIAVNSLWPLTTIATAAISVNFSQEIFNASRKPEIVADAAYEIFQMNSKEVTGNFFIDEEVLRNAGLKDFSQYAVKPGSQLFSDFFLD